MKRILTVAMVLALAVPAFALDSQLNGFLRMKGYMRTDRNFLSEPNSQDNPEYYFEQRFRAKYTGTVNEYLSFVYYGEVDFTWGDASYNGTPGRNVGAGLGGDTTNLETKNLYMTVKVPDTPVTVIAGLQGYEDNFDAVFFSADMGGIQVQAAMDMFSMNVAYMKWFESRNSNGFFNDEGDTTLSAIQTAFKPADNLDLGIDAYWMNTNGPVNGNPGPFINTYGQDSLDIYIVGAHAKWESGIFGVRGWFFWEGGGVDNVLLPNGSTDDIDVSAFAGSVVGEVSFLEGLKNSLRFTYFSSDDDANDSDINHFVNPVEGEDFFLWTDGFMIFSADPYASSTSPIGAPAKVAAFQNPGMWAVTTTASYKPPAMPNLYFRGALGYFSAVEDSIKGESFPEDKPLGTELTLRAGVKVAEKLDVSLNGSYAFLGGFYDNTVEKSNGTFTDPDDPYIVYLMTTLGF